MPQHCIVLGQLAHSVQILVRPDHIDFMGHVNNAEYLRWAQDVTLTFWQQRALAEDVARLGWVAREHTISYFRPAFDGDIITANIEIESVNGPRVLVKLDFRRNTKAIAAIKSAWCLVDMSDKRIRRLSDTMLSQFTFPQTRGCAHSAQ